MDEAERGLSSISALGIITLSMIAIAIVIVIAIAIAVGEIYCGDSTDYFHDNAVTDLKES
jgi:hypothetical protein